jgi:hypothetical protein
MLKLQRQQQANKLANRKTTSLTSEEFHLLWILQLSGYLHVVGKNIYTTIEE